MSVFTLLVLGPGILTATGQRWSRARHLNKSPNGTAEVSKKNTKLLIIVVKISENTDMSVSSHEHLRVVSRPCRLYDCLGTNAARD